MKVKAIKCSTCQAIIYSRARHDFRVCDCPFNNESNKGVHIDGGFDYLSFGWAQKTMKPEPFDFEVNATKEELYSDWNLRKDKYGKINRKEQHNKKFNKKMDNVLKRKNKK